MRQLLNTLFVTSEDAYLSLEGENVLVNREQSVVARFPLHNLQMVPYVQALLLARYLRGDLDAYPPFLWK